MTSPIEYTFDLSFYIDEHYCEVTYPIPDDEAHPIKIDYMDSPARSLETAIQRAGEDIKAYMRDPESWIEARRKEQE